MIGHPLILRKRYLAIWHHMISQSTTYKMLHDRSFIQRQVKEKLILWQFYNFFSQYWTQDPTEFSIKLLLYKKFYEQDNDMNEHSAFQISKKKQGLSPIKSV